MIFPHIGVNLFAEIFMNTQLIGKKLFHEWLICSNPVIGAIVIVMKVLTTVTLLEMGLSAFVCEIGNASDA